MTASNQDVRAASQPIIERLKTDVAFRNQVQADPTGTLTAAGLPADAVNEFMQRVGSDGEVVGYLRPDDCSQCDTEPETPGCDPDF